MNIAIKSRHQRRRLRVLALAAAAASLAPSASSFANVVGLTSSKDNTLYFDDSGSLSNGAGDGFFAGTSGLGRPSRGLVAFDLASLPTNAQLNSVLLRLDSVRTQTPSDVALHLALKDWGEGTSIAPSGGGGGAAATPGDATWLHTFYNSQFWTNPGGDFTPAASATANMFLGQTTFASPQLTADVQGWINDPAGNFGWVVTSNETTSGTAKKLGSKENLDPDARPLLSIDYSTSTWKTSGGAWSTPANWDFSIPDAAGAEANFTAAPAGAVAVSVDGGGKTVGIMNFGGAGAYTLSGAALTLSRANANNAITVAAGNHQIAAPLNLTNSTDVSVAPGSTLTVSGNLTAAGGVSVNKTDGGLLLVNNLRADALSITGGTLAIAPSAAPAGTSRVSNLSIAAGRFDLSNNKLIVNGGNIASLTALIQAGRNGGNWSGSGIVTSQTAATTGNFTSIGIATAQQARGLPSTSATAVFSGQTVTGGDALIMYTYGGDANLDGKINVDDYGKIDFNVNLGTSGWFNGDFNYDGKINVDDYGIIDFNVGIQGAPFPSAGNASPPLGLFAEPAAVSPVPEPAAAASLQALGTVALLKRRARARSVMTPASSAR